MDVRSSSASASASGAGASGGSASGSAASGSAASGSASSEETVILVSNEGQTFEVKAAVAERSELVKVMMEQEGEIPLRNVDSATLAKVIEYLRLLDEGKTPTEIPQPLTHAMFEGNVQEWEAAYVDMEDDAVFELIKAANFMDVQSLIELGCAKIASIIQGKTPEEIRDRFGIRNDFTPEEEERIQEENRWCENL